MAFSRGSMLTAMVLISGLVHTASAATYTVGQSVGWTFQTVSTFYDDEFKGISLFVGDVLFFPFDSSSHDVYEVSAADLATCTSSNAINKYTTSNATVVLSSTGSHSFICSFNTHCSNGMHLSVTVLDSAPTAAPLPATPAPGPGTVTAPVPSPSTVPTVAPTPTISSPGAAPTPSKSPAAAPSTGPSATSVPEEGSPSIAPSPTTPGGDAAASRPVVIVGAFLAGCAVLLL